uniref:ABC transporter I family member 11ic isoform X2 n=1 Tax=Rhizophora mucronata TaxID=61149 RepID=A0A2P2MUC1_RHIMU
MPTGLELAIILKFLLLYLFKVRDVSYRPPGTQISLLSGVSFSLPEKRCLLVPNLLVCENLLSSVS